MMYANRPDVLWLALPVVASRSALPWRGLHAALDGFLVRKLGVPDTRNWPWAPSPGGVRVLNEDVVNFLQIPLTVIDAVAAQEQQERTDARCTIRSGRPPLDVHGCTVILVMMAWRLARPCALPSWPCVNSSRPGLSLPFLSPPVPCVMSLETVAESRVCSDTRPFYAVGLWYEKL